MQPWSNHYFSIFSPSCNSGNSPLHKAAEKGDFEMVDLLLLNGAKTDLLNDYGNTPLNRWALNNGNVKVGRLLIENDSSVINVPDKDGNSPLHCAAVESNEEKTKLLLQYGASKDLKNKHGNTPHQEAKFYRHDQIAKLIIDWDDEGF